MLMLDTVQVLIPFCERYVQPVAYSKTKWELTVCVSELDRNLITWGKNVIKKNGQTINIDYFHPYDSIPTSYSGIGFKVFDLANNCYPYVILNCSIAKILQGHNVYGNLDMFTGICEMLGIFKENYPDLCNKLDWQKAWLSKFDVTLPALTTSRQSAIKIREYLRNVDWGRFRNHNFKANGRIELNTLYFGSDESKVGGFKIYCKGVELDRHLHDLQKQAKKGDIKALHNLKPYTDDVIAYADKSIRIEATVKKRMLEENNLPTNLWQFLLLQIQDKDLYKRLFKLKAGEFMQSLDGMRMPYDDDTKVFELLCKRLGNYDKNGNPLYTKAKNAYNFYRSLKRDGYQEIKFITPKSTFNRNIKLLTDAGFNKAYLQNLSPQNKETPVLRLLNLDMDAPLPQSYTNPVSNYYGEFEQYLIDAIEQVA